MSTGIGENKFLPYKSNTRWPNVAIRARKYFFFHSRNFYLGPLLPWPFKLHDENQNSFQSPFTGSTFIDVFGIGNMCFITCNYDTTLYFTMRMKWYWAFFYQQQKVP